MEEPVSLSDVLDPIACLSLKKEKTPITEVVRKEGEEKR